MATTIHTQARVVRRAGNRHQRTTRQPPRIIQELLAATGVCFNGDRPWDIRVHDDSFYHRILSAGSLGMGEAYMDGAWDAEQLDETVARLMSHDLERKVRGLAKLRLGLAWLREQLINRQSKRRAFEVGEHHYDIGNEIYEAMLDPTMSYSCGYWEHADDLDQAQQAKLELIGRKLKLESGQRVLDIGCGWGGLAQYLASNYEVEILGVTVSQEQQQLARERCAGLPVEARLMDYRDLPRHCSEQFDRIVSVGMFEHVGPKNYGAFFDTVSRLLGDDGLFLLHTIGAHRTMPVPDPWIDKYIFPNGRVPSARQIALAIEPYFVLEDGKTFGIRADSAKMSRVGDLRRRLAAGPPPRGA